MKTDKELLKIWKDYEETRRDNIQAEINFEALESSEKLRIFDLIKEGKHTK
jgi:hypothetical protein